MNHRIILLAMFFYVGLIGFVSAQQIEAMAIYEDSEHNAFTSLIKFKSAYYCAFRSGERHVYGRDGVIKIIRSKNLKTWKEHAVISQKGYDLRDPKLSISSDGRIMVLIGGSVYQGKELLSQQTHVSFSNEKGKKFSAPVPIELEKDLSSDFDWLWRVTWHKGTAYGVLYQRDQTSTRIVSSEDGVQYKLLGDLEINGRPNEATIRFGDNDEMFILHRREEDDKMGYWGRSHPPYTTFSWRPLSFRIGGPDFCILPQGSILASGRNYHPDKQSIGLWLGSQEGDFELVHEFPSEGDCSYPSFIVEQDRILMSYYASHDGSTNIYLANIPKDFPSN